MKEPKMSRNIQIRIIKGTSGPQSYRRAWEAKRKLRQARLKNERAHNHAHKD